MKRYGYSIVWKDNPGMCYTYLVVKTERTEVWRRKTQRRNAIISPAVDISRRAIYHEGEGRQIAEQWIQIFNCGENYSIIFSEFESPQSKSTHLQLPLDLQQDATFSLT
jgi:hypothetical protein